MEGACLSGRCVRGGISTRGPDSPVSVWRLFLERARVGARVGARVRARVGARVRARVGARVRVRV